MKAIFGIVFTLLLVLVISCEGGDPVLPDYPTPAPTPVPSPSPSPTPDPSPSPSPDPSPSPAPAPGPEIPSTPAHTEPYVPDTPSEQDPTDPTAPAEPTGAGWYEYGARVEIEKARRVECGKVDKEWYETQFDFYDAEGHALFYVTIYHATSTLEAGTFTHLAFKNGVYEFHSGSFSCDAAQNKSERYTMSSGTLTLTLSGDIHTFDLTGMDDANRSITARYSGVAELQNFLD